MDSEITAKNGGHSLAAVCTAALATAAIAGVAIAFYLARKVSSNPREMLTRCRTAIDRIESDLAATRKS